VRKMPDKLPKTLLVVDDDPLNLTVINDTLRQEFRTRIATDGPRALALALNPPRPDLILLDIGMPGMDGFEACAKLKSDPRTAEIPVIFLSAHNRADEITQGLELGAVDYLSKPVIPSILLARVRNHLRLCESRELLADQNRHLERLVGERTRALQTQTDEVVRVQELTIVALGTVAETRDNETGNHIFRTQAYVKSLVERLAGSAYHRKNKNGYDWSQIWKSAPLHDIGKVGIPDSILLKPGKLTAEEFNIMKKHTELGRRALHTAESRANMRQSYLHVAMEIAYCHHEKWNGKGYPEGIAGNAIPASARLMALADVYDALISKRVYKAPISHDEAVDIILAEREIHFDPDVVDCFLDLKNEFREIALKFNDPVSEPLPESGLPLPYGSYPASSAAITHFSTP